MYVNYFLDITEVEYTDVTYKTEVKDDTTGKMMTLQNLVILD